MKLLAGKRKADGRAYVVMGSLCLLVALALGMLLPGMSLARGKKGKNGIPANQVGNGNAGAIWTTRGDCGTEQQDVNHYTIGEVVFINGANFDPGTHSWTIEGLPGNASEDPGLVVASGSFNVGDSGSFCFPAYTVADDDGGEYHVTFGRNKHDNYRVPRVKPTDVPPTEVVPTEVIPTATEVAPTEVAPTETEVVPTEVAPTETEVAPTEVVPTEVAPTETEVVPTEIAPTETEVVRTRTAEPTQEGNPVPTCPEGYSQVKFEDPWGVQIQGPITLIVTRYEEGEPKEISFVVSGGYVVYLVYVKGGPGFRTYDYRPDGVTSGTGLVAPNRTDDRTYGISHVTFCYGPGAEATPTATGVVPTTTAVVPTATPVSETEVVPTATEVVPTATEVASTPTQVRETVVVPTATEVEATTVVRTATSTPVSETAVVPTATEVEATTVARTATSTPVSETAVVPTATEVVSNTATPSRTATGVVGGIVATRTLTPAAPNATATSPVGNEVSTATPGGETAPTATLPVENENAVRTPTSASGGGNDDVGGDDATPTSVVLPDSGVRGSPETLPVTATNGMTQLLQFVFCLAIGMLGLGLIMRGIALSQAQKR